MGQTPGQIPGHGEAPPVGRTTQWIDHSIEKDKKCEVVPDVDVACVERETELGKSTGDWFPLTNDCHTKTQEVLDTCSTQTKPGQKKNSGPDFGDPRKTGAGGPETAPSSSALHQRFITHIGVALMKRRAI